MVGTGTRNLPLGRCLPPHTRNDFHRSIPPAARQRRRDHIAPNHQPARHVEAQTSPSIARPALPRGTALYDRPAAVALTRRGPRPPSVARRTDVLTLHACMHAGLSRSTLKLYRPPLFDRFDRSMTRRTYCRFHGASRGSPSRTAFGDDGDGGAPLAVRRRQFAVRTRDSLTFKPFVPALSGRCLSELCVLFFFLPACMQLVIYHEHPSNRIQSSQHLR